MAKLHQNKSRLNTDLKLSMSGPDDTSGFRVLVNMTPSGAGLERRPSIVATPIGFSSANQTNGASTAHQLGSYTTELDLSQHTDNASNFTSTFAETNQIFEGIDVEIVQDRLVCVYLIKTQSGAVDLKLGWSWHWPQDPLLGSQSIVNSGDTGSSITLITSDYGALHPYTVASYWQRRIVEAVDMFMITGYGVGGNRIGGTAIPGTLSNDSIPIWESTALLMDNFPKDVTYGADMDDVTEIPRYDASSSFYIDHGPKEAFAHVDRFGQVFWYGFTNTPYKFTGVTPTERILFDKSELSLDTGASVVIMRPYDIFISEELLPQSLNTIGIFPLNQASGADDEVIGIADTNAGNVIFSRHSIQVFNGIGSDRNDGSVKIITNRVGCDARHSIKSMRAGVFFANHDGVHMLSGASVARIEAFDELFGEGVVVDRGPYGTYQGGSSPQGIMGDNETHDCDPWQNYKVDHDRLDRAVAGAWDDLYILFCSMEGHDPGDDNRLALVHNQITNKSTIWLLPKNMGVRGFAYNGKFSTPFVMTRYGLAKLDSTTGVDEVWVRTGSGTGMAPVVSSAKPYPAVVAQSRLLPNIEAAVAVPDINVHHTVRIDDSVDDDMKMRFQMWSHVADLAAGQSTLDTSQFTTADVSVLDKLYHGTLDSWYKSSTGAGGSYAYYAQSNGAAKSGYSPITRYVPRDVHRLSTASTSAQGISHMFQFHTLNPINIKAINVNLRVVAQVGRRS
tara:strand:- start:1109 stop:3307 length:2199 start_codon:yes stop_codon:yes gene_type:complete